MSEQSADQSASGQGVSRPTLRVERGSASAEDIAAIVAILAASGGTDEDSASPPRRSGWAARAARMRPVHLRGPGAWRSSAQPR